MKDFQLPDDHEPGMVVPKGGSSCATCEYLKQEQDGPHCGNEYFQQWNGDSRLPVDDPETYCSDWYEEGDGHSEGRPPKGFVSEQGLSDYRDENLDDGILVVNVTQAKELHPEYNASKDHRTLNGERLHKHADGIAKAAWKDNLKRPKEPAVLDTHGREPGQLRRQIEEAKATGAQVMVAHVLRDPLEAFQNGYIKRAMDSGRSFGADNNAESYADGSRAVQELQAEYANDPDVTFIVIDNRNGPGEAKIADLSAEKGYSFDKDAIKQAIISLADRALADGRLDGPRHAVVVGKPPHEAIKTEPKAAGDGGADSDNRGGQGFGQDHGDFSGKESGPASKTGPGPEPQREGRPDARREFKPERTRRAQDRLKAYRESRGGR